jgi:putative ABC transport system permease protein
MTRRAREPRTPWLELLLLLHPRSFRARRADELLDTVLAERERASRLGRIALAVFWLRVTVDLLRSAARLRLRGPAGEAAASDILHDVRHAWRTVVRHPQFTFPVVLSLALAIGANVAAFSVVNTLVFRPLPVEEPDRLFHITYVNESGPSEGGNYSWFEYVRGRTSSIATAFIAHRRSNIKVSVDRDIEALSGLQVTGEYYSGLGVSPQLGRLITTDDERDGSARVAVLSDGYWSRRFARDPEVLGRTIRVDDVPHVVIGVTPPEFFGIEVGRRVDVTVPIDAAEYRQGWVSMALVVRLLPDVSASTAAAELTTLIREFASAADERTGSRLSSQRVQLAPITHGLASPGTVPDRFTGPALIVSVIIALMLLLACTNWALLLLARASARRHEVAVRLALGSSRFQVARQTMVESMMLTGIASGLGFLAASWSVRHLPGNGLPADLHIDFDWRVLAFALALAVVTGILFSAAPIWIGRRVETQDLRITGGTLSRRGLGVGRALITVQVALSLIVLVTAAFFGATLRNLRGQDMGFSRSGVITFALDADGTNLEGPPLAALHGRVLDRLAAIQGVQSATLATVSPLSGTEDGKLIRVPGIPSPSESDQIANVNTVGPEYFSTFGIQILRGRPIRRDDTEGSPQVALISESAANHYFGTRDPIGSRVEIVGGRTYTAEIIGVVRDVMYDGLRSGTDRILYVPFSQRPAEGEYVFALKTAPGSEAFVLRELPAVLGAVAPDMPILELRTIAREIDVRSMNERLLAAISGFFGVLALLLAAVGICGIVAYTVARRTAELGLRIALGGSRRHVVWHVARGVIVAVSAGIAVGLVVAVNASDLLQSVLFGLPPSDPRVYAGAALVLACTGVGAALPPVLRAVRIHPVKALKYE